MGDYDDEIDRFDERVPDDIHPDDVYDYMRGRYSEGTMNDAFIDEVAQGIAQERRNSGRVPDDPRDVEIQSERGRGVSVGRITYDSDANAWRHEDTGQFVSEDEL